MLSREEVLRIARLARLNISEKEVEKMQKDLSAVLDYFDILKKIDTPGVSLEGNDILPIEKSTRKDVARLENTETTTRLIQSAPDKKEGYIKVKAIF